MDKFSHFLKGSRNFLVAIIEGKILEYKSYETGYRFLVV